MDGLYRERMSPRLPLRRTEQAAASAALLFQNALGFADTSGKGLDSNHVIYRIAVALELLFKACLASAGMPDTVRAAMGHDLRVAASLAQALGLDLPVGHANLVRQLHPHFRDGGFHRHPARCWPDVFVRDARTTILLMTTRVRIYLATGGRGIDPAYAQAVNRLRPVAREIFLRAMEDEALTATAASVRVTPTEVQRQVLAAIQSIGAYIARSQHGDGI